MKKKKIINRNIKGYYQTWKSKGFKIVNFSWNDFDGLTYAIWVLKKTKIGVKKPFIEYIKKMKIDEYLALKPNYYKYEWTCVMHAGYGSKISTKDFRKYINRYLMLKEFGENYKKDKSE